MRASCNVHSRWSSLFNGYLFLFFPLSSPERNKMSMKRKFHFQFQKGNGSQLFSRFIFSCKVMSFLSEKERERECVCVCVCVSYTIKEEKKISDEMSKIMKKSDDDKQTLPPPTPHFTVFIFFLSRWWQPVA